jgi:hypothetical protein
MKMVAQAAKPQLFTKRFTAQLGIGLAVVIGVALLLAFLLRPHPIVRNDPPFRYGNRYMEAVIRNNWDAAAASCLDASSASQARAALTDILAKNGKLLGYGSESSAVNPQKSVRTFEQPFTLIFQGRQAGIIIDFSRTEEVNGEWKIRAVDSAPEASKTQSGSGSQP